MDMPPSFDEQAAHRRFAATCFNKAWEYIEKPNRTADEDREMIRLSHASHWHWTEVEGHTPESISVAHWQTSRIYALVGDAEQAKHCAQQCLEISRCDGVAPFYLGYAYEALARAAAVAGDKETTKKFRDEAARIAASLDDGESRQALERDLETIP